MTDHWHGVKDWVEHHRRQGHHPHPAPTREDPEQWECKCDPDAVWTAVWRILTPAQVRRKFAHLSRCNSPTRSADPEAWRDIEEMGADQEAKNAELREIDPSHIPPMRIATRYAVNRPRAAQRRQ